MTMLAGEACRICGMDGTAIDDREHGETVCSACGCVLAERTAMSAPPARREGEAGSAVTPLLADGGLTDTTGLGRRDAGGRAIESDVAKLMSRMRRLSLRDRQQRTGALKAHLLHVVALADKLGTGSAVRDHAALLCRRIVAEKLCRGRNRSVVAAASLYLACRTAYLPRSVRDVAAAADLHPRTVHAVYRHLCGALGVRMQAQDVVSVATAVASRLGLPGIVARAAAEAYDGVRGSHLLQGRSPYSLAAGLVWLHAGRARDAGRMTKKMVAAAGGVSDVSLRQTVRVLRQAGISPRSSPA